MRYACRRRRRSRRLRAGWTSFVRNRSRNLMRRVASAMPRRRSFAAPCGARRVTTLCARPLQARRRRASTRTRPLRPRPTTPPPADRAPSVSVASEARLSAGRLFRVPSTCTYTYTADSPSFKRVLVKWPTLHCAMVIW